MVSLYGLEGVGFRVGSVQDFGFSVGLGCRVQGLGYGVQGLRFRV